MQNLKTSGIYKFNNLISLDLINKINKNLPSVFDYHENLRRKNNNPIISNGLALNALIGNQFLFDVLQYLIDEKIIDWIEENYFSSRCILNSFSALSNIPGENKVFHKRIHKDIRHYSFEMPLMLNMLVMLDDFTVENGATLLLPKSHLFEKEPTTDFFDKNAIHATGKAGDIIIWNSNIYHASGINKTNKIRRALPITFSLPCYKQLIDYPRSIGFEKKKMFNDRMKFLLGYESLVPANLSSWYAPIDKLTNKN